MSISTRGFQLTARDTLGGGGGYLVLPSLALYIHGSVGNTSRRGFVFFSAVCFSVFCMSLFLGLFLSAPHPPSLFAYTSLPTTTMCKRCWMRTPREGAKLTPTRQRRKPLSDCGGACFFSAACGRGMGATRKDGRGFVLSVQKGVLLFFRLRVCRGQRCGWFARHLAGG